MKLGNIDSVISTALGLLYCPADHRVGTVTWFSLPFSPVPEGLRAVLLGGRAALQRELCRTWAAQKGSSLLGFTL